MEKFKAVEKAMKTKAYSKEGLSAASKLDPKEQAKVEVSDFLSSMVEELEQQVEHLEAEGESIQATMKKGKSNRDKAERVAEIEAVIDRHKWHQGKLELILRSLENGAVEPEGVRDVEDDIRYYVSEGMQDGFHEDEDLYEVLNLENEEDVYGMNQENEKGSSDDTPSIPDDIVPDPEPKPAPSKARTAPDPVPAGGRRPSMQLKSPLLPLTTLHTPLAASSGSTSGSSMKPASLPTRPATETLRYASAAAAAAASDKSILGIAPLPPPPGSMPLNVGINPLPPAQARSSTTSSPAITIAQPAVSHPAPEPKHVSTQQATSSSELTPTPRPAPPAMASAKAESSKAASSRAAGKAPAEASASNGWSTGRGRSSEAGSSKPGRHTDLGAPGTHMNNGIKPIEEEREEEESTFHLPSCLNDLLESYEMARRRPVVPNSPAALRLLQASARNNPHTGDADVPRPYHPDMQMPSSQVGFPETPLPIFDDPRLYSKIDQDTLFYVFYYKQGTYQQFLAARALKEQSWRFHKQYQTWFQRHEEPKSITEEFEQGTYRFFDYESTWFVFVYFVFCMVLDELGLLDVLILRLETNSACLLLSSRMNRRKADFKFTYKFLEDEI